MDGTPRAQSTNNNLTHFAKKPVSTVCLFCNPRSLDELWGAFHGTYAYLEGRRLEFRGWRICHRDQTVFWIDTHNEFHDLRHVYVFLPEDQAAGILALEELHASVERLQ